MLALVPGIERLDRVFPIGLLDGEIERVLEWPGCSLRGLERRFRVRAGSGAIAALQRCGHQTLAAEDFGVLVLQHARIGALCAGGVAANFGGAGLQQQGEARFVDKVFGFISVAAGFFEFTGLGGDEAQRQRFLAATNAGALTGFADAARRVHQEHDEPQQRQRDRDECDQDQQTEES